MNLTLKIWRQENSATQGKFKVYPLSDISKDMSFLEMLDVLNESLESSGQSPVAFDHDCREGICGMCSLMINGRAHGPVSGITTCQLHMRHFNNGDTIVIEPFRAKPFPVLKDLIVDRTSFDTIIQAGGYISVNTGSAHDGNTLPISKVDADEAMDAAACIGCGACVATCKNGAAVLFVGAKVSHLAKLPQGKPERARRVRNMVQAMDDAGFGNCSNERECEVECPKSISVGHIARLNREFYLASLCSE